MKLTNKEENELIDVWKKTALPRIKLLPVCKPANVYDCKFGGVPYLPPNFDYPYNTEPESGKKPLKLLAQINFAKLPRLQGFPADGILQFFVANEEDSDMFGLNLKNQTLQEGWRVIYHRDIVTDESLLQYPPVLENGKDVYFPVNGEFGLEVKAEEHPITFGDYRYREAIKQTECYRLLESKYGEKEFRNLLLEKSYSDGEEELEKFLREKVSFGGSSIGGYPTFTQYDPRAESEYGEYTVLLLQIDSYFNDGADIMFGDTGIANFFIKPADLAKADFSDVMYNWDCC